MKPLLQLKLKENNVISEYFDMHKSKVFTLK